MAVAEGDSEDEGSVSRAGLAFMADSTSRVVKPIQRGHW